MATYNARRFFVVERFAQWFRSLAIGLYRVFDGRPVLMRGLLRLLALRAVWQVGRAVVITGDAQVRAALSRDDDFPLPEERLSKFLTGAFVLGMARTPQHRRERAALEEAVRRTDRERIESLIRTETGRLLGKAAAASTFDVVQDLSNPIGETLLREYFGISTNGTTTDDLRLVGAMIASPCAAVPEFRSQAANAAARLVRGIRNDVNNAFSALGTERETDTVLQRLVRDGVEASRREGYQWDPEPVSRNMAGVLLPGSALVTRAFALGVVQIFTHPELLRDARRAKGDVEALGRCMLEALRFHPVFPLLPRFCPRPTQLPGHPGPYRLPANRDVYVVIGAAMFDRRSPLFRDAAGHPSEARLRPRRQDYLHFGGGAHECLGTFIAVPQLAAMLDGVLGLPVASVGRVTFHHDDVITPEHLLLRLGR